MAGKGQGVATWGSGRDTETFIAFPPYRVILQRWVSKQMLQEIEYGRWMRAKIVKEPS